MKKTIDLNDNSFLSEVKTVLPYVYLGICGIAVFEYLYYYHVETLLFILTLEDVDKMQQLLLYIGKISLLIINLIVIFGVLFEVLKYLYMKHTYTVTFNEYLDFKKKVKRMQALKVSLKRIRANIDDEFPLIELEKVQNSYILHIFKNHWFNRVQVEKNTDFFKSVIKLPLYKLDEDYDKITLVFTAEKNVMQYDVFSEFLIKDKILIGYDEHKQPIYWNYNTMPHLLGVGPTGAGKSNLMKVLIDSLLLMKAKVYFADGKRVELIHYRLQGYEVATENFVELFEKVHTAMMSRYKKMEQESIERKTEVNHYTKLSFDAKPIFLVIDEWASIIDNLSRETKRGNVESDYKKAIRLMKDMLQLGRAAGIQVISFMQDSKATTLDTSIRNNFNMRILLGTVKEKTVIDMVFGSEYRNIEMQEVGAGYFMADDRPQVFKTPEWCESRKF